MSPPPRKLRFPDRSTEAAQVALFWGLYDALRTCVAAAGPRVRLLNPTCGDEDPATRRFAQLEID